MANVETTAAQLLAWGTCDLGTSDWLVVDQDRIDAFAAATDDHQWIHVDADQARTGPFGTTIAHGFLSLLLVSRLLRDLLAVTDAGRGANDGVDRVRFLQLVAARAQVRLRRDSRPALPDAAGVRARGFRRGAPAGRHLGMNIATQDAVDRDALDAFLSDRRRYVLITTRSDGRPQVSPVTGALADDGRLLISTYPARAKARNLRRDPDCAVLILSDDFDGPWVQVYGSADVLDDEAGVEALVDYYRAAAGEHDDWDEYRAAMRDRGKVCLAITVTDWGPVATGGIPPEFAD